MRCKGGCTPTAHVKIDSCSDTAAVERLGATNEPGFSYPQGLHSDGQASAIGRAALADASHVLEKGEKAVLSERSGENSQSS